MTDSPVYLYTPPLYYRHQVMRGALRYRISTSTTVYRLGGVWNNVLSPGISNPDPAACDVEPRTGLRLYFNKPVVVPVEIHDELAALEPADPTWTPGSLTLL